MPDLPVCAEQVICSSGMTVAPFDAYLSPDGIAELSGKLKQGGHVVGVDGAWKGSRVAGRLRPSNQHQADLSDCLYACMDEVKGMVLF